MVTFHILSIFRIVELTSGTLFTKSLTLAQVQDTLSLLPVLTSFTFDQSFLLISSTGTTAN